MSYNNIGLVTPRGTATSGYVQRNLATLKSTTAPVHCRTGTLDLKPPAVRKPNKKILEHKLKRKIELLCLNLRERLASQNIPQEEITSQEQKLREKYKNATLEDCEGTAKDTHALLRAQGERNRRLKKALNISEDHKVGDAFKFDEIRQRKSEQNMDGADGGRPVLNAEMQRKHYLSRKVEKKNKELKTTRDRYAKGGPAKEEDYERYKKRFRKRERDDKVRYEKKEKKSSKETDRRSDRRRDEESRRKKKEEEKMEKEKKRWKKQPEKIERWERPGEVKSKVKPKERSKSVSSKEDGEI